MPMALVIGMGDIENFAYDFCEARISRLSLVFSLYFYLKLTTNVSNCS